MVESFKHGGDVELKGRQFLKVFLVLDHFFEGIVLVFGLAFFVLVNILILGKLIELFKILKVWFVEFGEFIVFVFKLLVFSQT